jgi:hypothetical protein
LILYYWGTSALGEPTIQSIKYRNLSSEINSHKQLQINWTYIGRLAVNNPIGPFAHVKGMRKPIVFATIIVFAVAIIIIIPFGTLIVQPTVIAAQHESNSSSSQNTNSSSAASPSSALKTIFKQVEDSVVQITSKIPTGAPNALPPQSENATLGS